MECTTSLIYINKALNTANCKNRLVKEILICQKKSFDGGEEN
jgi:hypothetical protein